MRALIAILLSAIVSQASALEFRRKDADGLTFLSLEGPIAPNDGARFASFATEERVAVLLRSEGGDLAEALAIGRRLRAKGYVTVVRGGDRCIGACALVWLSGTMRGAVPTSRIGFSNEFADDADDRGRTKAVFDYLKDIGASYELTRFVMTRHSVDPAWLTPDLARELGIDATPVALPADGPERSGETPPPSRADEPSTDDEAPGRPRLRPAAFDIECMPYQREGRDPTEQIIVSKVGDRWLVRHVTVSGATYDRGEQYAMTGEANSLVWSGRHLRRNDTEIRGEVSIENGTIHYNEKVFRDGELFADMTSKCETR